MTVKYDNGKVNFYYIFNLDIDKIISSYMYIPNDLSKEEAIELSLDFMYKYKRIKNDKYNELKYIYNSIALLVYVLSDCKKIDIKKPLSSLLTLKGIEYICKAREFGIRKYGENDLDSGDKLEKYRWISAYYRHIKAYILGEENDIESGLPHLAHSALNLLLMVYQYYR